MKLIVNIPNELAEKEHWYTDKEMWTVIKAAQNGTPLDMIRAEIMDFEEELFYRPNTDYSDYAAVRHCMEIIDKYKAESEADT